MRRKKHHRRRSRRMSGLGAAVSSYNAELGAAIGGAAGGFLNKIVPSGVNPKLTAGGKIVLGAIIRRTGKGAMSDGIGLGMVSLGVYELLLQMGILNGIGAAADTDMIAVSLEGTETVLAGGDDLNVINGTETVLAGGDDLNVINGLDEEYMGADFEEI